MDDSGDKSILVISAHPDDECLGSGGTIRKHVDQGIPVDLLCLTGNEERNRELQAACEILGIRKAMTSLRDDFAIDESLRDKVVQAVLELRPKIVITHTPDDYNRNHVMTSHIVDQAIEWASHKTLYPRAHRVDRVYHMEVNTLHARPHIMVNISTVYESVVAALGCHVSQIGKVDNYYLKFYEARTRLRGVQAACKRAEAFTVSLPFHAGPFYPKNSVERLF